MAGNKREVIIMKLFFSMLFTMILLTQSVNAEFISAGKITDHTLKNNCVEFKLVNGLLCIYILTDNMIRIRYTNKDKFFEAPSYAVIQKKPESSFSLRENKDCFEIKTKELFLKISINPCRISIFNNYGQLICEDEKSFGISTDGDEIRCFKTLHNDELFFGLGEKTGFLNRRGNQYMMWNTDMPFYTKEQDPLYVSIPFFIGLRNHKAYGIFLDNTYRSFFNMGAGNDRFFWFGAIKGELDYYFIQGPEIKKIISSYTDLTGKMELPPLWALGFQQSRWSYPNEFTVKKIASEFRNRKIPCDAIYLDIDYMDGYRVFTWDKKRFPHPEEMLSSLSQQGFKIIPIIDPGVKADDKYFAAKEGIAENIFVRYPDGEFYKGEVWPSWAYFPDFTMEKARQWWGEKLFLLIKQGVMGIWNDMNEPAVWGKNMPEIVRFNDNGFITDHRKIHNVYALEMAKATSDALHKYSEKRCLILTRAGFSGIQKYCAVWTGDNYANVDHLIMACTMPQSMGLSGLPFVGADVGGFGGYPSQNLYIRWMQLGSLTPFFRAHSEITTPDKEPWALGGIVEKISREAIEFRYSLLPYLYNEFYNASQTGIPIMRAMFLEYQDDAECYKNEAQLQFMLGDSLLAAPVLSEHDTFRKLYLPQGCWINLSDNKRYNGRQWITVDAPLSVVPLFLKKGGFIAMQESQNYVNEKRIKELEFKIFPSESTSYSFYEDDGVSRNYKKGEYSITKLDVKSTKNEIIIKLSKLLDKYDSKKATYCFSIYTDMNPGSVITSGKNSECRNEKDFQKYIEAYSYDAKNRILHIRTKAKDSIEIKVFVTNKTYKKGYCHISKNFYK